LAATSATVPIYIGGLIQQGISVAILDSSFYAIKWYHDFYFENNPCSNKLLSLILEGGKRLLSKPVCKKDPITPDILQRIIAVFGDRNDVSKLRICVLFLLAFSGFLRYSELSNIKMNNLEFQDAHIKITIAKSKTDMNRIGSSVIITKTDNDLCPVFWLKRYIELTDLKYNSDEYIFRSLSFFKSKGVHKLCTRNVPLSYTRAREILLSSLDRVGLDKSSFGLHSLGSGGASSGANHGVSDRLLKMHGCWVTDRSKDGYIKDNLESQMAVFP
jgi:integrase